MPIFTSLTVRLPVAARRRVAMRASLIAFLILCGAALAGDWLLRQLGIGLPAFRIAGGLLLFSIASEMVFGVRIVRDRDNLAPLTEGWSFGDYVLVEPYIAGRELTVGVMGDGKGEHAMCHASEASGGPRVRCFGRASCIALQGNAPPRARSCSGVRRFRLTATARLVECRHP